MKPIVEAYFLDHPECRDEVMHAFFAYHCTHFRDHPKAHNFTNGYRVCACRWCGRTREDVRWQDASPHYSQRPPVLDIQDTIMEEENRFQRLLKRANVEVPKLIERGVSGKELHATYGFDDDTVASVLAEFDLGGE